MRRGSGKSHHDSISPAHCAANIRHAAGRRNRWPMRVTSRLLGTAGCQVHMADSDDVSIVHEYPCGSWFQPPVGRYLFWLEQGPSISYQTIIYYAGEKFTTAGKVFLKPMYPAGSVQLDVKTTMPIDGTLRLLSLDSRARYRPFDRRILTTHAKESVRVPVGRVIASIFDDGGRALSLSRPLSVTKGGTTPIVPDYSRMRGATVLTILNRFVRHTLPSCNGTLVTETQRLRPDIDMQAYDRIVFAWYGVQAVGRGRLELRCGGKNLLTQQLRLRRGAIETIRAALPNAEAGPSRRSH
jgi:hypothetical protein